MFDIKDLLTMLALLLTAAIAFWGFIRWTITKIESRHSEAMRYTDEKHTVVINNITRLDSRVNEVRDEYVKRSDLDRDFKALEKQIDSMNKAIAEGRSETNHRLDRMLMLLGKVISNNPGTPQDFD